MLAGHDPSLTPHRCHHLLPPGMLRCTPCVAPLSLCCGGTAFPRACFSFCPTGSYAGPSRRQLWSVPCHRSSFCPAPRHTCARSRCRAVCCHSSLQRSPHHAAALSFPPSSAAAGSCTCRLTRCPRNALLLVSLPCRDRHPLCASSAARHLHSQTSETPSPGSAQPWASVFPHTIQTQLHSLISFSSSPCIPFFLLTPLICDPRRQARCFPAYPPCASLPLTTTSSLRCSLPLASLCRCSRQVNNPICHLSGPCDP